MKSIIKEYKETDRRKLYGLSILAVSEIFWQSYLNLGMFV